MMKHYTFLVPLDRGPEAWERYTQETIQLGPFTTKAEAWESLAATVGQERADNAEIVRIEREDER